MLLDLLKNAIFTNKLYLYSITMHPRRFSMSMNMNINMNMNIQPAKTILQAPIKLMRNNTQLARPSFAKIDTSRKVQGCGCGK